MTFEEWMFNCKNHKYSDNTIQRYIRALDKCEEWLNISLPYKIQSIHNSSDFEKVLQIIYSVPDYKDINYSHGHGDLSAALKLYKKYIQDEESDAVDSGHNKSEQSLKDTKSYRRFDDLAAKEAVRKIHAYIIVNDINNFTLN